MSGQFTFYVATVVPTFEISICSVAVFGTRYIRDEPLQSTIEIEANRSVVFSVPHVHAEDVIGNHLAIDLRQKAG